MYTSPWIRLPLYFIFSFYEFSHCKYILNHEFYYTDNIKEHSTKEQHEEKDSDNEHSEGPGRNKRTKGASGGSASGVREKS